MAKYEFIDSHVADDSAVVPITDRCRWLEVSTSGFYHWKSRPQSATVMRRTVLAQRIRVFFELSTWHLIQWLYAPRALRDAQNLRTDYADARLHGRLMWVLNERLGHRLANTVEQAKIAASLSDADAPMPLDWIEPGLAAAVTSQGLAQSLEQPLAQVVACAQDCVRSAGLAGQGWRQSTSPGARRR